MQGKYQVEEIWSEIRKKEATLSHRLIRMKLFDKLRENYIVWAHCLDEFLEFTRLFIQFFKSC